MKTNRTMNLVNSTTNWNKKLLPGALLTAILALAGASNAVQAIEFSSDDGEWTGSFDTTVSYGAAWRISDLDEDNVGKSYFNPYDLRCLTPRNGKRRAAGRSTMTTATATIRMVAT